MKEIAGIRHTLSIINGNQAQRIIKMKRKSIMKLKDETKNNMKIMETFFINQTFISINCRKNGKVNQYLDLRSDKIIYSFMIWKILFYVI